MAFVEGELRRGNQSLQALVGVGNKYQYRYFRDYDLQFPKLSESHPFVAGTLRYVRKEFEFNHEQKYCFNGEDNITTNYGDYTTENVFKTSLPLWNDYNLNVQAEYDYRYEIPNMFYRHYAANTVQWEKDLAFESRHHAGGELFSEFGDMSLRADYYQVENYVYFTAGGTVAQTFDKAQSAIFEAKKTTDLRWLSLQNSIIFQQSDIAGTKTPTWATYNSVAVRFKFYRKLIDCLVGAEALYYQKYYAPQFIPSLGVYAPQMEGNEEKLGDFPIVNAFLTVKYKPLRFMLKYNGVFTPLERNFLALHYPQQLGNLFTLNSGILVFSASWLFYN